MIRTITMILTQACLYQGLYVTLAEYVGSTQNNFIMFGLFLLVSVLLYALRNYVKKLPAFLGGHLALLFLAIQADSFQATILLVMTIVSLARRLRHQKEKPEIYYLGVLGALYILCLGFQLHNARSWLYWGFVVILLSLIFHNNLDAADDFIRFRNSTTSMDEQKLRATNLGVTAVYTAILGVILLFAGLFSADQWGIALWDLIRTGLKKLFQFLAGFAPEGGAEEPPEMMPEQPGQMGPMMPLEEAQPSWFAEFLNILFVVLAYALAIAGVIAAIVAIAIYIYRHFYRNDPEDTSEERTFIMPFTTRAFRQERTRETIQDRGLRRRIRRLYKKQMRGFWIRNGAASSRREINGQDAPKHLTPREQLQQTQYEAAEEIRAIYEKARYSPEAITPADYERMRELFAGRASGQ